MVPTTASTDQGRPHQTILTAFEKFEQAGQGACSAWLHALNKGGIAHFAELGFPTQKDEEWRFINITPLAKMPFTLAQPAKVTEAQLKPFLYPGLKEKRFVFVNGTFAPELSAKEINTPNFRLLTLQQACKLNAAFLHNNLGRYARYDENPFVALNTAFLHDGAAIIVGPRHVQAEPIHIIHVSTAQVANTSTHPRTLIVAGRESEVKVIESFVTLGDQPVFTNSVVEIVLEESARVEHCKLQKESLQTYHIASIHAHQARMSNLLSHSISIGGALARNNITCALEGEGVESTLNGLYLTSDTQVVDHHTAIHHNKPNCNSFEYYHGILDGRSQGVFNGKIFVRPEAQKTDAKQTNRNLLLSDTATINTKPQLEIFADDVKCTHGATIGQLDQESIFYLRARGIGLENARRMLVHAFASEIVNRITIDPIRDLLDKQLFEMYERE
ncbi:MAG: Fe-S cluster assembly protein SufD [Verrucomicrobiales bacterium]